MKITLGTPAKYRKAIGKELSDNACNIFYDKYGKLCIEKCWEIYSQFWAFVERWQNLFFKRKLISNIYNKLHMK